MGGEVFLSVRLSHLLYRIQYDSKNAQKGLYMKLQNLILFILVSMIFTACGSDSSSPVLMTTPSVEIKKDEPITGTDISSKFYGTWSYVHSGEKINIISTTNLNVTEVEGDDNLLKVDADDTTYYLIRSGIAKTKVKGKVEVFNDSTVSLSPKRASGYSGIGSINIILSNVLDENIKEETVTESDGSFNTTTLPSGTYKLKASDANNNLETTVSIVNEENDIGVYKLTGEDLNNFKAELIINNEYILSNGNIYEAVLRIHNISENTGYGLSYDISLDSEEFVKSFTEGSVDAIGSVVANSYKDIPISFSFDTLSSNMKEYGVEVTIKDALGNQWIDTFSFNVNKDLIAILIATKSSSIKGYIKSPLTGRMRTIDTADGKILVPLMPADKPYMLVLSNPSLENETAYSIGVNTSPQSFESFKETSAHEPNNIESQSTTLNADDSTLSYLHATDIDYWKIYTKEGVVVNEDVKTFTNIEIPVAPSRAPESLVATDGDYTDKIEVSWVNNSIATYFELYQATDIDGEYANISNQITQTVFTVNNAVEGVTYYYKVKGCNDVGCSDFSNVNSGHINVQNIAPLADAGENKIVDEGMPVTLNGSGSTDSDGTIISYRWIENSAILSEDALFTISSLSGGIHEIALVVTDNEGAISTDIVYVTVKALSNKVPVADAGQDQIVNEGDTVSLNGSLSNDSDGSIVNYIWRENENILSISSSFKKLDFTVGTHILTLTVTDNDGEKATDTVTIYVNEKQNLVPIANAGADQIITNGDAINFDASASSDEDGFIVSYTWTDTTNTFTTTNAKDSFIASNLSIGTNIFTLTVTDNSGVKATDTVLITVREPGIIVYDSISNLEWEVSRNGNVEFSLATQICIDLKTGGYDDWRLPTIEELETLYNLHRSNNSEELFIAGTPNYYWSTTGVSGFPSQVKSIYFGDGYTSDRTIEGYTIDTSYFKCVRNK